MAWSRSSGPRVAERPLGQHGLHGLEEPDVVPIRIAPWGTARAKALTARAPPDEPVLPVLLREDAPGPPGGGRGVPPPSRRPLRPVEAGKRSQHTSYFSSMTATASSWSSDVAAPAARGVRLERLLQLPRDPQVVHHEPAGLVPEDAVHPAMACMSPCPRRLVEVHGGSGGASNPVSHMSRTITSRKGSLGRGSAGPGPRAGPCCGRAAATGGSEADPVMTTLTTPSS